MDYEKLATRASAFIDSARRGANAPYECSGYVLENGDFIVRATTAQVPSIKPIMSIVLNTENTISEQIFKQALQALLDSVNEHS